MTQRNLDHLAVARKLAADSGRPLSACMGEAAEIIAREHLRPQLPRVRALYILWAVLCTVAVADHAMRLAGPGAFLPGWAATTLLGLLLMNIFWLSPELPLMSRLWTRWNTPLFLAAMVYVLTVSGSAAVTVNSVASILYLGVALLALLHGAQDPARALDTRISASRFGFRRLSARDQGRIFFLAPWISPFGKT